MGYSMFQAGADVNAGRPVTPLIVAAADGLADCVKCLLEAGADANIPDEVSFCSIRLFSVCLSDGASELVFS
jgi:ankyrin repeat protein